MRLDTRISLFFLVAIAVVLAGFSGSIYWIVRAHLYRQLDHSAVAALDTLTASIEFTAEGLEWEPKERRLSFGATGLNESLIWSLYDGDGQYIDGTPDSKSMLSAFGAEDRAHFVEQENAEWNGAAWRISRRELKSDAKTIAPQVGDDPATKRHARLYLVVGRSIEPLESQLRSLALSLAGISIAVWLIAALLGGWLCRNALAPLTQMTHAISSISPADLSQRLARRPTKDQLGELTQTFNQLLSRLQTSFERQRRFAADASHQLRTPLTSMLGHVEVALRRDRSASEYHEVLESVQAQSVQLSQIIEMLMLLAREGADVVGADCRRFELNDWLDDYLPQWQQHPRFKDIQLDVDRDAELLIRAHQGLLGQAIDNLLDNACKYSDANSAIIVRTSRASNAVTLEVEDHGYGISEADLARVRIPFCRSDDARRRGIGGAGLGLSVTDQIITAFGARLLITSAPGQGSVVTIVFRSEPHHESSSPTLTRSAANATD